MCVLEKLNFKISRGSMPPDPPPPSVLAPPVLHSLSAESTPNWSSSDAENGKECQIEID